MTVFMRSVSRYGALGMVWAMYLLRTICEYAQFAKYAEQFG